VSEYEHGQFAIPRNDALSDGEPVPEELVAEPDSDEAALADPELPGELEDDPFAGWPEAKSSTVIEDVPQEGESVEHVSGELDIPDGYTVFEGTPIGRRRTVAIVVARFNGGLTNRMLALALETLEEAGVDREAVTVMPVPGAFELPLAAMALAKTRRYACVVALGAIVRRAHRRDRRAGRGARRPGGRSRAERARDGRRLRAAPGKRSHRVATLAR
jgi:hypothetical protein